MSDASKWALTPHYGSFMMTGTGFNPRDAGRSQYDLTKAGSDAFSTAAAGYYATMSRFGSEAFDPTFSGEFRIKYIYISLSAFPFNVRG